MFAASRILLGGTRRESCGFIAPVFTATGRLSCSRAVIRSAHALTASISSDRSKVCLRIASPAISRVGKGGMPVRRGRTRPSALPARRGDGRRQSHKMMRKIGGISHRMLTLTLRGLEREGVATRTAYATIPPKVEYELTDLGRSLITPLMALAEWALEHRPAVEIARTTYDGDHGASAK